MIIPLDCSAHHRHELNFDSAVLVQGSTIPADLRIFVEPVRDSFLHCCTPSEIIAVLSALPPEFTAPLHVILHQPTHKRHSMSPVWGRMLYYTSIRGQGAPTILLSAQNLNETIRWSKSMGPERAKELERLREDGHRVRQTKRCWEIVSDVESIRQTLLMRTLPHEVGHIADYETFFHGHRQPEFVEEEDEWTHIRRLSNLYFNRPSSEREEFAHRFAHDHRMDIEIALAFSPALHSPDRLIESSPGIEPEWFVES